MKVFLVSQQRTNDSVDSRGVKSKCKKMKENSSSSRGKRRRRVNLSSDNGGILERERRLDVERLLLLGGGTGGRETDGDYTDSTEVSGLDGTAGKVKKYSPLKES